MDEGLRNLILKADQGDVEAMVMVGDCYNKGFHTEKDDKMAHAYYKKAADVGHTSSALMIAIDYLNGMGTAKNKKLGVTYLTFAADNGIAYAQFLLATLYKHKEIGLFGNERKAIKYYEMAAKQGDAKSQIELADIIWNNKNSKYSLDDMLFWLVCAYLHTQNKEESNLAMQRLNALLKSGLPGGKPRVDEIVAKVKRNYQQYTQNPY